MLEELFICSRALLVFFLNLRILYLGVWTRRSDIGHSVLRLLVELRVRLNFPQVHRHGEALGIFIDLVMNGRAAEVPRDVGGLAARSPVFSLVVRLLDVLIELYGGSADLPWSRRIFGDHEVLGYPRVKLICVRWYAGVPIGLVATRWRRLPASQGVIFAAIASPVFDTQSIHVVASDIVVHLFLHGFLTLDAFSDHRFILFHCHALSHLFSNSNKPAINMSHTRNKWDWIGATFS